MICEISSKDLRRTEMAGLGRLLANLIVMGGGVLSRAFVEAYKQALASKPTPPLVVLCSLPYFIISSHRHLSDGGNKANGAANAVRRGAMAEMEARNILNVRPKATEAEILEVIAESPQAGMPSSHKKILLLLGD